MLLKVVVVFFIGECDLDRDPRRVPGRGSAVYRSPPPPEPGPSSSVSTLSNVPRSESDSEPAPSLLITPFSVPHHPESAVPHFVSGDSWMGSDGDSSAPSSLYFAGGGGESAAPLSGMRYLDVALSSAGLPPPTPTSPHSTPTPTPSRSEERRVGKECRN